MNEGEREAEHSCNGRTWGVVGWEKQDALPGGKVIPLRAGHERPKGLAFRMDRNGMGLVAEDIFGGQLRDGTNLAEGIQVEILLVAEDGVVESAALDPLLLEVDYILQGHTGQVVVELDAANHPLTEVSCL